MEIGAVVFAIAAALLLGIQGAYAFPFVWITLALVVAWAVVENFGWPGLRAGLPPIVTFTALLTTYLWIPPNCGVPKYDLAQELTSPAPLDPQRLYLSVYPAPELAYRVEKKTEPFGTTLRPGSTSMWGGLHFINGYSPIRPSGVAREFECAIHGEIRPELAPALLEKEAGAEGKLARLGVDGIIVAHEMHLDPQPFDEWELADYTEEGRVFHRAGPPLARVRSVTEIDSRPNEQFAEAGVSRIVNGRNRLQADVTVPANGPPALLTISRPFFNGYRATIGHAALKVDSYRGLIPTIEVPAGMSGRLTLAYRPWWLIYGGAISLGCLVLILAASVQAWRTRAPANV
jgi:hypothetical protein